VALVLVLLVVHLTVVEVREGFALEQRFLLFPELRTQLLLLLVVPLARTEATQYSALLLQMVAAQAVVLVLV
jgi:hypothetical protein